LRIQKKRKLSITESAFVTCNTFFQTLYFCKFLCEDSGRERESDRKRERMRKREKERKKYIEKEKKEKESYREREGGGIMKDREKIQ